AVDSKGRIAYDADRYPVDIQHCGDPKVNRHTMHIASGYPEFLLADPQYAGIHFQDRTGFLRTMAPQVELDSASGTGVQCPCRRGRIPQEGYAGALHASVEQCGESISGVVHAVSMFQQYIWLAGRRRCRDLLQYMVY